MFAQNIEKYRKLGKKGKIGTLGRLEVYQDVNKN